MRLTVEFNFSGSLILPIHYHSIIQGFIYHNLSDRNFAEQLHEEGFPYERRPFKLFTFSRLIGQYKLNQKDSTIAFASPVKLVVSSIVDEFVNDFGSTLMLKDELYLGKTRVKVQSLKMDKFTYELDEAIISTLSPIVTYSTVVVHDMRKTLYHKPGDLAFASLLKQNLLKKYQVIYGSHSQPSESDFDLQPINGRVRENVIKFKGIIIKGWTGEFILRACPQLMRVGFETGLGSKNSMGFGCFEIKG